MRRTDERYSVRSEYEEKRQLLTDSGGEEARTGWLAIALKRSSHSEAKLVRKKSNVFGKLQPCRRFLREREC